jgi:hypothetical protein
MVLGHHLDFRHRSPSVGAAEMYRVRTMEREQEEGLVLEGTEQGRMADV